MLALYLKCMMMMNLALPSFIYPVLDCPTTIYVYMSVYMR
jgi:hypothetical protein